MASNYITIYRIQLSILFIGLVSMHSWATPIDLSRAKIVIANPRQNTSVKAAGLLKDEIERRTRIVLEIVQKIPDGEEPIILIGTASELESHPPPAIIAVPAKPEAYGIWVSSKSKVSVICTAGHDRRGTVFAV